MLTVSLLWPHQMLLPRLIRISHHLLQRQSLKTAQASRCLIPIISGPPQTSPTHLATLDYIINPLATLELSLEECTQSLNVLHHLTTQDYTRILSKLPFSKHPRSLALLPPQL